MMITCLVSAAATLVILGSAARSARLRVASQYTSPDYIRYITQGYEFDTVSSKTNLLLTVTDGELPVRIHILTIDSDKKTLDILELPPDSFIIADGYSGTVRDAFKTNVYSQIVSHAFSLRLDGSLSFDSKTFGDAFEMLGVKMKLPKGISSPRPDKRGIEIDSAAGEKIALDGFSYSGSDESAVRLYRAAVSALLCELCERGSLESFSTLMNLIVNRVETDMSVEKMIGAVNSAKGIRPKKMNLWLAPGCPAKYGEKIIWALDRGEVAELLNGHFRVKDIEIPEEELSIPHFSAGEPQYKNLPERVTEILN